MGCQELLITLIFTVSKSAIVIVRVPEGRHWCFALQLLGCLMVMEAQVLCPVVSRLPDGVKALMGL